MDTDNLGSGLTSPNGRAAGAGEYTAKVFPPRPAIAAAADAMASIVPHAGATGSGAGPAAHLGLSMGGGSFWYKYA